MNSIGIDIGGSHITSGMYEHSNKQLIVESVVNRKVNTSSSKEEILGVWVSAINETISKAKVSFQGIGFAMPGPFDYYNGISLIKGVEKLESLYGADIRQELSKRLNLEPSKIRFINDATAFSVAEARIGEASKYNRVVAITLGTGFGSSFLIDSQPILNGSSVPKGGFLYNQIYKDVLADDMFSTRGIVGSYYQKSGILVKNVRELCEYIPKDAQALEILQRFGTELGIFIKPFLEEFEAEVLVIGGNISRAFKHFSQDLEAEIPNIHTYVSSLGEEAAIIGSALLLDDDYYQKLETTLSKM